jgi:hypothetical protein
MRLATFSLVERENVAGRRANRALGDVFTAAA